MSIPFYTPKRLTLAEIQISLLSIARLIGKVSVSGLPSMTLAELNSKVTDATLDDSSDSRPPTDHADNHIPGGTDDLMSRFMVMNGSGLMADEDGILMQMR